jgi:signal peptidase II
MSSMEDHSASTELPRPSRRLFYLGLVAALVTLALDQASKLAILALFDSQQGRHLTVLPFFNLYLTYNRGITFGLFNDSDETTHALIISGLALAIVAVLLVALARVNAWYKAVALGMIIGGALGNNLIDRLRLHGVVDFLDFHLGDAHFYVFNIGDSAICIGVGLLLLDSLLIRPESPK